MYNTWSESYAPQQKDESGLEVECFKEKKCDELASYAHHVSTAVGTQKATQ